MLVALCVGLFVGLVHVVTGPDHLGAIAPIACAQRSQSWTIGLRWGLGHSLGVCLVALVAGLLAHWALVDPFSSLSERLVGILLLIIAAWGAWRWWQPQIAHSHTSQRRITPYAIGIMHGCAGGSHLVGIVVALAFPTVAGVGSYVVGFIAGTLLAMTAFAAGIGWIVTRRGTNPSYQRTFLLISSVCSGLIGCWWLFI